MHRKTSYVQAKWIFHFRYLIHKTTRKNTFLLASPIQFMYSITAASENHHLPKIYIQSLNEEWQLFSKLFFAANFKLLLQTALG